MYVSCTMPCHCPVGQENGNVIHPIPKHVSYAPFCFLGIPSLPMQVPGGGGVRLRHAATNVPCCGSRQRPAVRQEPGLPTKGQHGSARPCKCQQSGSGRSRSHRKKIPIPARRYHSSLFNMWLLFRCFHTLQTGHLKSYPDLLR